MEVLTRLEIETAIRALLKKYHAEYALLFGSYARGEATANSDIDLVVVGGADFRARDIFAFGEDLRQLTRKDVDAFEIRELNVGTPFYENVMQEGVRIGEQVYQLSSEFKASYPDVPWNMVAGLRHRLVHDYDGINWTIIVDVLFTDMAPFIQSVENILAGM